MRVKEGGREMEEGGILTAELICRVFCVSWRLQVTMRMAVPSLAAPHSVL